ncbi:MAG: hypothetical protein OEX02_06495 [Cyclobacteriaceae bacterium]|nr:hypothetical protein [Cyclobacteriaceae bacterium]
MKTIVKLISLSLVMLCAFNIGHSQSYADVALMYSRTNPGGSARIQGLGGAQISLGGDPSQAVANPAGIGMANRSSISFTAGIESLFTNTSYYGENTTESRSVFNIPQLGMIFQKKGKDSGYLGGAFAINFNRINTYHNGFTLEGRPDDSIVDYFLSSADGRPLSSFDKGGSEYNSLLGLSWFTFILDTIDGYYDSYILDLPESQREETDVRGSHYQWSFAYGGNYEDKLFFGVGMGLTNLRYRSVKRFKEYFPPYEINSIDFNENLNIDGTGINVNLGLLVRPIDIVQFGLSYVSPTFYNINDEYDAFMAANWNDFAHPVSGEILGEITEETEILISDYSLTAPAKLGIGGTVFFGKMGFLTADIETVNYSRNRLNSRDFSMSDENDFISSSYQKAVNVRVGGELRYKIFRVRAGGAFYGDPYAIEGFNSNILSTSVGAGIRARDFYTDFAFVNSTTNMEYYPYYIDELSVPANIRSSRMKGMLTLGFNF